MPKQAALGFAKRTLARCRKYEVTGKSCFSEPPFRDIIFAPPPRFDETELLTGASAVANGENVNLVNAATTVGNCLCDICSLHFSQKKIRRRSCRIRSLRGKR